MVKNSYEYCNKKGINASKNFGDKYGKNLMDTAKKKQKNCRSNRRFDWKHNS